MAWEFRDLESQLDVFRNTSSCTRKTYNPRSTGPDTVKASLKDSLVSGKWDTASHTSVSDYWKKKSVKAHKGLTMTTRKIRG